MKYTYDFIADRSEVIALAKAGYGKVSDAGTPWGVLPCLHATGRVAKLLRKYKFRKHTKKPITAAAYLKKKLAKKAKKAKRARR